VILHAPFAISARLLPAVQIGQTWISIEFAGETWDGRVRYRYYIDTPDFEHEGSELKSGCGGGSIQSGMESLLCFLGAAAESYRYQGCQWTDNPDHNCSLFPENVCAWAYQNSDEISMLECELQEGGELIED